MPSVLRNLILFNFIPFLLSLFILPDNKIKLSVFWGWVIVFIGLGIGILAFEISKKKNNKDFLKIYFGGMIVRLILLLALIFVILKFISISPIGFLFSLFIFYIINQIIEFLHISKSVKKIKYD